MMMNSLAINYRQAHSFPAVRLPEIGMLSEVLWRVRSAGSHQKWYTPPMKTVITLLSFISGLAEISSGNWR